MESELVVDTDPKSESDGVATGEGVDTVKDCEENGGQLEEGSSEGVVVVVVV